MYVMTAAISTIYNHSNPQMIYVAKKTVGGVHFCLHTIILKILKIVLQVQYY